MARKHFTVADVDALIPTLDRVFMHVLQLRAALRALEAQLERANVRMDKDDLVENDDGPPAVRRAKALYRGYYEALSDELDGVRVLGGDVKDIDGGLVDFPAVRLGQAILLCWRYGERRVGFWHPVEGGFAARRPVDDELAGAPQQPAD
jgi:hypothetical protein